MIFKLVDVDLYYNDELGNIRNYLCAIGEYDENNKDCEDWDEFIFFWFDSEKELIACKEYDPTAEFTVVDYLIRNT